MASLEADLARASELSKELSKLLPRLQQALVAKSQENEKAAAKLSAAEAALAAREAAIAAREEQCKATALQNEQALESLKQREQAVNRKAASVKRAPPGMDSLSMQVLARATATALLKTQISTANPTAA